MKLIELQAEVERLRQRAAAGRNSIRIDNNERKEDASAFTALQHHLALVTLEQASEAIVRQAERTLRCLARGERVKCTDCQSQIPLSRLTAAPFAGRCVNCQELFEEQRGQPRRITSVRNEHA